MANIYGYQNNVGLDRGEEKCFFGKVLEELTSSD
jgi:hypothetical protein